MNNKNLEEKKNKKILVALPNTGYYHYLAVNGILGMQIPEGYDLGFRFMSNCLIYDAREKLKFPN